MYYKDLLTLLFKLLLLTMIFNTISRIFQFKTDK